MIRIIVVEADAEMAAHVGGPIQQTFVSFDYQLPELQIWLEATATPNHNFRKRSVVGIEIVMPDNPTVGKSNSVP